MNFIMLVFSLGTVLIAKSVTSLGFDIGKTKQFTFSENSDTPTPSEDTNNNEVMTRQLIVGTGSPPSGTTCICVPSGQCPTSGTGGGGQIDIRIVNNPSQPSPSPGPCQYGLIRCCIPGSYRCGVRYPPVAGSRAAQPGQAAFGAYPWQVAVLTTGEVYLGSGALIDRRHVLTTAHKVNNLATNAFKIRLGEWDAATTNEPIPAQDYTISRVFIHPNFNANNLQNDVAVLRLSTDVPLGQVPTIATVCLPSASYVGQRCYVSGWGKNAFGSEGSYQTILREVDVPIKSSAECQSSLSTTRLGSSFVFNTSSFICAGGELGKDACTGDGGSPLVCQVNNQWYVVGLVAWGIGCATGGIPGVYVNVFTYLSWIQTSINTA